MLEKDHVVDVEADPSAALFRSAEGNYELMIVSLSLENFDGLRLCSQLRSLDRTRNLPILALCEPDDNNKLMRGLEIGINDYLLPSDRSQQIACAGAHADRRKRHTERLRDNVQMSIEAAITDGLTGLHNRRYMESHLSKLVEQAVSRGKELAVLVLDIDYFKSVNDNYGHDYAVTMCCANSRSVCASRSAVSISLAVWVARNSSWSCRKRIWRWLPLSPSACVAASL